jgi:hypothetical protein
MRVFQLWLYDELYSASIEVRETYAIEPLVLSWDFAVTDKLNLRLMGNRLEIGM